MLNATRTTIYVEGTRKVIVPDVFFDLGVIHIINGVLIPPSFDCSTLVLCWATCTPHKQDPERRKW